MTQSSESPDADRPSASAHPEHSRSWPERHVNLIVVALLLACLGTLAAQAIWGLDHEHHPPHFPQETWFGFEAAFGFVAFVAVVFLGRLLRLIIARPEGYYDE